MPLGTTPQSVSKNPALAGITLPNTGGINLLATLLVTKTLLIAGEGWGGEPVVRAYDKKTGAVVAEVGIPGQMGSMPDDLNKVNGQQYIAFTVGSPTEPAEKLQVALALERNRRSRGEQGKRFAAQAVLVRRFVRQLATSSEQTRPCS